MAKFVFRKGKDLLEYSQYEDIPKDLDFDHVIAFQPDIPTGEHTEADHAEIEHWNAKLQKFMEIERARSNKNR